MEYVSTTDDLEDSKCLKEDFLTPKSIEHLGKKLRFCGTLKLIRSIDARIMKLCLKIFFFFKYALDFCLVNISKVLLLCFKQKILLISIS